MIVDDLFDPATLDLVVIERGKPVPCAVLLDLHHREVANRDEVLEDVRRRVGPELDQGHSVHLV